MESTMFESVQFLNKSDEMIGLSEGAKFDLFALRFAKEGEDYTEIKNLVSTVAKDNKMDNEYIKKHSKGVFYNIKRCLQVACDLAVKVTSAVSTDSSIRTGIAIAKLPKSQTIVTHSGELSKDITGNIITGKWINTLITMLITFACSRVIRYCVDVAEFASIRKDAKEIVQTLRNKAKDIDDEKIVGKMRDQADKLEREVEKRQGWLDKQVESIESKFKKK